MLERSIRYDRLSITFLSSRRTWRQSVLASNWSDLMSPNARFDVSIQRSLHSVFVFLFLCILFFIQSP
jgi:hypothetical protein